VGFTPTNCDVLTESHSTQPPSDPNPRVGAGPSVSTVYTWDLQPHLGDRHRFVSGRLVAVEQLERAPDDPAVILLVPGDPRAQPPVLHRVVEAVEVQGPPRLGERVLVVPIELVVVLRVQRRSDLAGVAPGNGGRVAGPLASAGAVDMPTTIASPTDVVSPPHSVVVGYELCATSSASRVRT